ncbi:hypothetical protein [Streptomyces sp. HC307]|uniref:hypothetical protein n=1 Tax=Streptomyces flavusporus TaxID=3385496 RepID=UPI0039174877
MTELLRRAWRCHTPDRQRPSIGRGLNSEPLKDIDAWLDRFRRFRTPHLDALATEQARGKRERRLRGAADPPRSTS